MATAMLKSRSFPQELLKRFRAKSGIWGTGTLGMFKRLFGKRGNETKPATAGIDMDAFVNQVIERDGSIGGFPAITEAVRTVDQRGVRRLSPFTIPSLLVNLAAGQVSIRFGFKGPLGAPVTACAAGVQAIGDAARLIRSNEADIAICGGTEACMNIVSLGGFAAARSLSTGFNETPSQASRPFDMMRDGFVMGEGAGMLVIEALSHALARGATPLAELVEYGTTADGRRPSHYLRFRRRERRVQSHGDRYLAGWNSRA